MLSPSTMLLYRAISLLALSIPTAINLYIQGSIVSALIYVPLITLVLAALAIFIDEKLEALLNKRKALSTLTVSSTDTCPKSPKKNKIFKPVINAKSPADNLVQLPQKAPVVLISAGVGITPMQAMLETFAQQQYNKPVHYLHACENSVQHSFSERTAQLIKENNWQQHIWYRNEEVEANQIYQGIMDLTRVELPIEQANFYLCGPIAFMQFAKNQLLNLGVAADRVHYEVFGPHANL